MLWKKKEKIEETKYFCKGINFLKVVEVNGENLDEVKKELFKKIKFGKKILSMNEIQSTTDILKFDIWNSFIWIDAKLLEEGINKKQTNGSTHYRWLGIKDIIIDVIEKEQNYKAISEHLNHQDFYLRTTIQDTAAKVGFDVFNRSNWESFTHTILEFPDNNLSYEFYGKVEKHFYT